MNFEMSAVDDSVRHEARTESLRSLELPAGASHQLTAVIARLLCHRLVLPRNGAALGRARESRDPKRRGCMCCGA